ncbi:DNA repair protein RAD5 [Escovopsis weberi]|uniref:DNA repair protein RAD5 n=1 Tax=Escovopsis weberi TaxID=150374 RepID=A0A0M8MWU4_ESCWE|nr:DNA repair protein RAD5 [Escovopsis weberi]
MDCGSSQEPPVKRRRFFRDPDEPSSDLGYVQSSPPEPTRFFKVEDEDDKTKVEIQDDGRVDSERGIHPVPDRTMPPRAQLRSGPNPEPPQPPQQQPQLVPQSNSPSQHEVKHESSEVTFDKEMFESFIGTKVKPDVLRIIKKHCGDNLERAVNMYFDGTYKRLQAQSRAALSLPQSVTSSDLVSTPNRVPTSSPFEEASLLRRSAIPQARYIGAFGVEGWATRSGANLIKHGDIVHIERQKIQPKAPARVRGKFGATPTKPSNFSSRRVDVIVRFTTQSGQEVGRLAKDTANWVSTLIDQKVVKFEGNCVYCPERVRTNDTIFLQLRCSLLDSAFLGQHFKPLDERSTPFEQNETDDEKKLRLRQVALVKLLHEINLQPTVSNAAAKDGRKSLLAAAEMDEQKQKEAKKATTTATTATAAAAAAAAAAATATATATTEKDSGDSSPSEEPEEGQELEQDQLDALYKKAQTFDFNTPEAEPPETFALTLRPYQKQSLHWMVAKEKNEKSNREVSMHPLWEEYLWPTKDADDQDLPVFEGQPKFYVNPYSGELSLDFPAQEQACLGGILADEMGLGKTIQMLSLIHTQKSPEDRQAYMKRNTNGDAITALNQLPRLGRNSSSVLDAPFTTLVVAPMSLLSQWQSEAVKASWAGSMKIELYYGNEKASNLQALCCASNASAAPDLVITSYGIVLSEFSSIAAKGGDKTFHNGIFSLKFRRVILDEAHVIKNRASKTAKACYEITATHRWVLTGTPIVNRLEDLFSLVRFLGVEPWNNFSFWKTFITVPFESGDFMRALDVVQTVLEPLVMRRTKDMKTRDGQPLVPLPPKQIEIVNVELSKTERDVYEYIFTKAKRTLSKNVEAGTVMKAFTTIFAQILRLRQSCCHPVLIRNKDIVADEELAGAAADAAAGLADDMDLESLIAQFTAVTDEASQDNQAYGAHALDEIRQSAEKECPLCFDEPMNDQVVTGCWHSACKKCLLDYMKHESDHHRVARCVNCREPINQRDLFEIVRHDDGDGGGDDGPAPPPPPPADLFAPAPAGARPPRISLQRIGVNASSSKVAALIGDLRALRREHPRMKSVIFSQFTSFLSLIEPALGRASIRFLRLDGTMAQRARAAVLQEFSDSAGFVVLLISLRAGGVGLNLTSAGRVFMMDPWWSFAVEAQAIDRVHRLGQEGEVVVKRFIVKDSVEERMLKVQERKKFIATSLGMMSDEEKKMQRLEDIKDLLS